MIVDYLDLADYVAIAAEITGLTETVVLKVAKLDLADSALHAPSAEFGGEEFYPDLVTKAAVLLVRLVKNHPLPDGNKRAAWVAMRYFLIINDLEWSATPDVDDAERAVVSVASGKWGEAMFADWLRERLNPPSE